MTTGLESTYNENNPVPLGVNLVNCFNGFIAAPSVSSNFFPKTPLSNAVTTSSWFKWKIGSSGYPVLVPEFTITLNNQGATTAGTASVTATFGNAMPSITVPQKTGYTFGGYYTAKNGGDTQYYKADGTSAKDSDFLGTATLYAKWTANTYTVTYNENAGSDTVSDMPTSDNNPQTVSYGTEAKTPETAPARIGYTFLGWSLNNAPTLTTDADYAANTAIYTEGSTDKWKYVFAGKSDKQYDLAANTGGSGDLYAVWQGKVAHADTVAGDETTAANDTTLDNFKPSFTQAAGTNGVTTITLLAKPECDLDTTATDREKDVAVASGVGINLYNNAGKIATTAASTFDYLTDGSLILKTGKVTVVGTDPVTIYVNIPGDDLGNPHKVVIEQDGNGGPVAVGYSADDPHNPIIENAGTGDEVTVDGTEYTGGGSGTPPTITLSEPPRPFPGATEVEIPAGVIDEVSVSPTGNAPTVATPAKQDAPGEGSNSGTVTIKPGSNSGYPVTVNVEKSGDKVTIDPDGTGTGAGTEYETTADGTELEVASDGKTTLTKGGVELDYVSPNGEGIYIKNPVVNKPDVLITNKGTGTPVEVSAEETTGGAPYTVVIPNGGGVIIGGTTYKNPSPTVTTTLTVTFDDEGDPIVTLTGGTTDVPKGGTVVVNGTDVYNDTGHSDVTGTPIRVKAHGDTGGGVDVTVPAPSSGTPDPTKTVVCRGGGVDVLPVGEGGEIVLKIPEGGEVDIPGAVDVDVKITDGTTPDPDVTVAGGSTGDVTVKKTDTGFETKVENDTGETTTVTTGGQTYTIPESTTTILTTPTAGTPVTLVSGAVELDNSETVVVDGVTVTNTSGAVLTVTETDDPADTDDGKFKLTSGNDTFDYTKADGDTDLTVGAGTGNALQFVLDATGEKVIVPGTNIKNTEFSNDGTNVFVTIDGTSTGDITVTKTAAGFETEITNDNGETSTIKAGNTEYTIPQNITTKLNVTAYNEPAKLVSGAVELEKENGGERIVIPTAKSYTLQNSTDPSSTANKPITVTRTSTGANIRVPAGDAFTVITTSHPEGVRYATKPNTGITTTYVTDGTGNVQLADGGNAGDPEHGVKLKLDMGKVELTPSQTIYANVPAPGGKLISNPNESGTLPVDAGDGEVDTVITLTKDQSVDIGGTLLNGTITGTTRYTALSASAELALDKTNPIIPDGTVLLKSGKISMGAGAAVGVSGATSDFMISVPTGEAVKPISVEFTDNGTTDDTNDDGVNVTVQPDGEFTVTVEGSPDDTVYHYVNHSEDPVVVPIKNDGTLRTVLKDNAAPSDLPTGNSYEGYCQSVSGNTTQYYFEDNLDTLLSKAYLDAVSDGNNDITTDDDSNKDNASKTVKNTIVLNTAVNPTTTGYILTQNCIDIYTAQGNLAKNGNHGDMTAYTAADAIDGVDDLYTVDSRERSQQYVGNQDIADDVTSCMVVKISNESGEPGHVEVQAGEAKIKWSNDDTTYYVTLADAIYDAAHNADATQYNTHDGAGKSQTIIMNINPYGDRVGMTLEKGDKLIVRGEDVSKEGDSFTAITDAAITMYTAKKNNVYLTAGTVRADNATAEGETANGVKVYVNTADDSYYATSDKSMVVTGGKTTDADTFASLLAAARVATTEANQSVTVGIGGTDTAIFTAVLGDTSYPICRVGKLDNMGDKVVVEGSDTTDYTVYSLAEKYVSPYTPRAEYATVTVSGANTGDTTIINGVETNKISTVVVKSAKANDTFTLLMPREQAPAAYRTAEDSTDATFKTQYNLQLTSGGFAFVGKQVYTVNGVSYNGKEADADYKVGHRTGVATVDICDELYAIGAGKTVYVNYGTSGQSVKYGDKTYTSTNSTAGIVVPGKTKEVDPGAGSYIYVDRKDATGMHFYVQGPTSDDSYNVPVSGNGNSVKISATVSGGVATVKEIKDADLAKVTGGETVEIDLTGIKQNIDSAKIPTATVEKIAEKDGMSVKMPVGTVTFDKSATQEIVNQANGKTIQLVVDDIKEVSLNAVQKEAVEKLDTALIIDAYLVSDGARLCSESKGGFGGGKATVTLPFEIKNNRSAANYNVFYVDDAGNLEKLAAKYDTELSAFVFDITHFSNYVVSFDENAMPFVDVPANEYFYDAVKWAVENGITTGVDAVHFGPEIGVTRAQVVTFLWRAAGCPEPVGTSNKFTDLLADQYYIKAVAWAIEQGITKGITETTFEPETVCTRGQIVTFLARFAGVEDAETESVFSDVPASEFFAAAVKWAKDNGVTSGVTETTFEPYTNCTRAQVVTFLYRWMVK